MLYCCGHGISSFPCISILAFVPSFSSTRSLDPGSNGFCEVSVEILDFGGAAKFGLLHHYLYQSSRASEGHENAEYTAPPKFARCSLWIY